jgi:hypothetical protein
MPDRSSSNDLVLEQIRELLEERRRDTFDGINLRALNRQLSEHSVYDEKRHGEIEARIREVEQNVAHMKGEATGRFNIPPVALPIITPMSSRSKRPSTPPWLARVTEKPATIILVALATVLIHALLKLLH